MSLPSPPLRTPEPTSARGRDTFERLLDAAERLFAERGFEGTSMRAVTQAAGASVSAANYHFGSKDALLRASLLRRVEPTNRLRLERLGALEARVGDGPLALEDVLHCFLSPSIELHVQPGGPDHLRQVAARLHAEPSERMSAVKRELFGPLSERFREAVARALPDHTEDEIALSFQLTVGVMVHVISGRLELADPPDDAGLLEHMIDFVAAGMRAAGGAGSSTRSIEVCP
jgi:AcrR family transcriptional regulator